MEERIIQLILQYQNLLNAYLKEGEFKDSLKSDLVKQMKVANLALTVIQNNEKIEAFEVDYFEGQAFVGRYFGDWKLDWVVWNYYEISMYVLKYHCLSEHITKTATKNAIKDYVPFKFSDAKNSHNPSSAN